MDFSIDGREMPLVKRGLYQLAFDYYETVMMFGRAPKVVMAFKIIEPGEYFGVRVYRYYNATRLTGKHGRNGRFSVARNSDFLREYVALFPSAQFRNDRVPVISRLRNAIVIGELVTVTTNSKQHDIPEPLHYSKVARLVNVVVGE